MTSSSSTLPEVSCRSLPEDPPQDSKFRRSRGRSSSLRDADSPRRGVLRSVSFSDDEAEIVTVKKIAVRKREKEALWFSPTEYKAIRGQATLLAGLRRGTGLDITDSDEHSTRGLENLFRKDLTRVLMAKQSVLEKKECMYSYFSKKSVEEAKKVALKDAAEAAAYQREEASRMSPKDLSKEKHRGLRKFLPTSRVK